MDELQISRGDICMVQLLGTGSVQRGYRPCIVFSGDDCNIFSPTITVIPCTSQIKSKIPTHTTVYESTGIRKASTVLAECITCVDKSQIRRIVGRCSEEDMERIELCVLHHLALKEKYYSVQIKY